MPFSLLPRVIAPDLPALTPEWLQKKGIRLLMLDFDNTIVPYTTDVPTEEMRRWLDTMAGSGIQVCIVSNSRNGRVPKFCEENGLPCIVRAHKPGTKGIRECLQRFSCASKQAALAGDQIFTDTLGANCAGVTSILVNAIHNHTFWLKARHVLELPFIFAARKRRIEHEKS